MSMATLAGRGHRWIGILFTLTVVANFAYRAVASGEPPPWLTYSPLPPLFLQLFSGLYLFALSYFARSLGAGRVHGARSGA